MNNRSVELRLSQVGEVMLRTKENGTRSERYHRTQITRKILHHLSASMHQREGEYIGLRNRVRNLYGVGLVEGTIIGKIVHSFRVVDPGYTVCRRHKLLGMSVRVLHVSMQ